MQKPKINSKNILITLVALLILAVVSTNGYKLHDQKKDLKNDIQASSKKIADLEKQIKQFEDSQPQSEDSEETDIIPEEPTNLGVPTDQEISAINQFYTTRCAPNLPREPITRSQLESGRYYNGYAKMSIGCLTPTGEGMGGYISYIKKQTDSTWVELFGAQELPDCVQIDQHKVPKQIEVTCAQYPAGDIRNNTN
jgi:hypothetical protein